MKKKFLLVFAILLVLGMSLSACKAGEETVKKENEKLQAATSAEIGDYLLRTLKFEDTLTKLDEDLMKNLYLVDASEFEDGYLNFPTYTAEEIAVIKVKNADAKELKKYKKIFNDRIELQKSAFSVYRPEEVEKLDKALVYCKGNTAILVVSNDKEAAEKAIKNFGKDEE